MKSRTEYIRPSFVDEMRQLVKTYKEFKKLVELWVDLSIEHSRLKTRLAIRDKSKHVLMKMGISLKLYCKR